jgi:glyoxylase-like metal-dependent hydrolase (beta-lactamase superfamily II)
MTAPVAIADGLYRVDAPLGARFASLYLVVGSTSVLLFDTGIDGTIPSHVIPALESIGAEPRDVKTVVVSHCDVDHFGGVADAREQFSNASILAHPLDRPAIESYATYVRQRGDSFLAEYGWAEDRAVLDWCRSVTRETRLDGDAIDGQAIDLGDRQAVVWHVPGHSRGHTAIEVPAVNAILVSDAVLGASVDLADGTPAFPPTYRYVDDYLGTITRLESAGHDLLLTAHYPQLEGASAAGFLAESREFTDRLDGLVADALTAEVTLAELLAELNPIAGAWPVDGTAGALAFPVVGHLERLIHSGAARRSGQRDGIPTWSAA